MFGLGRDLPDAARHEPAFAAPVASTQEPVTGLTASDLAELLGLGSRTASGERVTVNTAERVSTVYACDALISGAIAGLPLGFYERGDDGQRRPVKHEWWWLFNERACEAWTSFDAVQYLIRSRHFHGSGFGRLLRPSPISSRVIGWEPLNPLYMRPFWNPDRKGERLYRYTPDDGAAVTLDAADVIHLPGPGFDGLCSPSLITYNAREAIGTALASERFSGKFFSEGMTADIILKAAGKLSDLQVDQLRNQFAAKYAGSRLPVVLSGGVEAEKLTMTPQDAALMPSRLFSVEEICRMFGVPPVLIGHMQQATAWGTGIEQLGLGFVRYTLMRYLVPLAQELNAKLWPSRQRYFVEHVTAALERGDLKSRYEAYRIAMGRAGEQPWMDAEDVRRIENMGPKDLVANPSAAGQPTPQPQEPTPAP